MPIRIFPLLSEQIELIIKVLSMPVNISETLFNLSIRIIELSEFAAIIDLLEGS